MASTLTKFLLGGVLAVAVGQAIGGSIKVSPPARESQPINTQEHKVESTKATVEPKPIAKSAPNESRPSKSADLDDAARAVALVINLNGYLCAKPIEVRQAGADLYGVRCIMYRSGEGRANYLVNTRSNEVSEI